MVACLGYGVPEIVDAFVEQANRISYFYNHHFTSEPQERLADRLLEVVAPGMARVRLVSGGSEANETALQLARLYHVERGDTERWRVISQAQSYHGSTMGTLALNGRRALQEPYTPYLASHLHIPPSTWRFDPSGEAALAGARPATRGGGPRDGRRVLLRAGERGGAPRRLAPGSVLEGPRGAPGRARVPDLLRRGRERDRPRRELARRGPAADRARHRRDREGARRRLRAARRGALSSARLRRDRSRVARVRPRPHVGRRAAVLGRRARRPGPPRRARARRAGAGTRTGPAGRARSRRSRDPRSCGRCGAEASSSAWSSWTPGTGSRSCRSSSTSRR